MRSLPLAGVLVSLVALGAFLVPNAAWLDPVSLTLVVVVPWLSCGPRAAATAVRAALDAGPPGAQPLERVVRPRDASALRSLGDDATAAGVAAAIVLFVAQLRGLALAPSSPGAQALLTTLHAMALGPAYGLALRAFVYRPLAERCDAP